MKHMEAAAAQRVQFEAIRDPRCEAEHGLHRGLSGRHDRDSAAHRETEQERTRGVQRLESGTCVVDARVEASPRLDAIFHLAEGQSRKLGCEPAYEPFERRAPGALHLTALPTVEPYDSGGRIGGPGAA